jgi:hypothetical protein
MPEEKVRAFLEAFSELPQKILWKWESDSLPGQPVNVKTGKWLPQQDILGNMAVYDRKISMKQTSPMTATGVQPFDGNRPHPLLWADSRAACDKITDYIIL